MRIRSREAGPRLGQDRQGPPELAELTMSIIEPGEHDTRQHLDDLRRGHVRLAIYALAETAKGGTAVSSHPIRYTFTARRSVKVAVNGLVQTQDRGYSKLPSA